MRVNEAQELFARGESLRTTYSLAHPIQLEVAAAKPRTLGR